MTELHYSDQILDYLVKHHGWMAETDRIKKQFANNRVIYASFSKDEPRRRYLTAEYGWKDIIDIDCRGDPVERANVFNELINYWIKNNG